MGNHSANVTVDAWMGDCIEGECEHVNEDGEGDLDLCPMTQYTVCVECMADKGAGIDEEGWDGWTLEPWPHPGSAGWTETPPPTTHVDPSIFRECPESNDPAHPIRSTEGENS